MKKSHVVAPLYKGLVQNLDSDAFALMTKRDPTTGNQMEDDTYIQLMQRQRQNAPELVQNVARAAASAVIAHKEGAHLICVEGCPQQVGNNALVGSEIMEHIWTGVVPREILQPNQLIIEDISGCTIEEVRAILQHVDKAGIIDVVTHEYHLKRTNTLLKEEKEPYQSIAVRTPSSVANGLVDSFPKAEYLRDLIGAGEPTEEFIAKERTMERILGPLHSISRVLEKGTFGQFNLEMQLAAKMRK